MAQDRPTASELLSAIADFLREEATPALDRSDPRLGFQMRVAVNSLAILEREWRLAPEADARELARLKKLLGRDGSLPELHRELARQLRAGERDETDAELMAHLEATTADKIAIANPKWR
jgi:hypothetical protein